MEENGQLYNVYIDGEKKLNNVACGEYKFDGISAGTHTVVVTSVLGNNESAGVSGTVTVTASTEQPTPERGETLVEINGCQISATAEGYRVIYTVNDPDKNVAKVGLVYGLADRCTDDDMVVGSTNSTVYSYEATDAGKMNINVTDYKDAQSYAMTMKLIKTAEFYKQVINVRAYIQLDDGSYMYSDIHKYNVYEIAEHLYQNRKMTNISGHEYLYTDILSVVNPDYKKVIYNLSDILV